MNPRANIGDASTEPLAAKLSVTLSPPSARSRMSEPSTVRITGSRAHAQRRWKLISKRALDLVIAVPSVLFAMPIVLIGIALIVLIDRQAPFFAEERVGRGGLRFRCWKLRTMRSGAQAELLLDEALRDSREADRYRSSRKLTVDPRITRIGRLLRKTSIDEMPQLSQRPERRYVDRRTPPGNPDRVGRERPVRGAPPWSSPRNDGPLASSRA